MYPSPATATTGAATAPATGIKEAKDVSAVVVNIDVPTAAESDTTSYPNIGKYFCT